MGQKFGQHFLTDQIILQQMQRTIADIKKEKNLDCCIEIGPGEGALTKRLKSVFETEKIIAFEADESLKNKIHKFFPLEQVVRGDVLKQEIGVGSNSEQLPANKSIVVNGIDTGFTASSTLTCGNLPYYITSPILRKFFETGVFQYGWFLIQKEVAEKIASDAKKKSFLRWIMNYQYHVETIIEVPPEAFTPPPKVDSAVITVTKKSVSCSVALDDVIAVLDQVSQYSRKTLGKISKLLSKRDVMLVIPEQMKHMRVEELSWEEMDEIVLSNREVDKS